MKSPDFETHFWLDASEVYDFHILSFFKTIFFLHNLPQQPTKSASLAGLAMVLRQALKLVPCDHLDDREAANAAATTLAEVGGAGTKRSSKIYTRKLIKIVYSCRG